MLTACWVGGCSAAADQTWIAWPELAPDTFAFLIPEDQDSMALGPFGPEGPDQTLYLPGTSIFLVEVERARTEAAHPMVELSGLEGVALGSSEPSCAGCGTACLLPTRDRIETSLPDSSRVWRTEDGGPFTTAPLGSLPSLSLRLPLDADCEDRRAAEVTEVAALPQPGTWSQTLQAGPREVWVWGSDLLLVRLDGDIRALSEQRSYGEVRDVVLDADGTFIVATNAPPEVLRVSTGTAGIEVHQVWALDSEPTKAIAANGSGGFVVTVAELGTLWLSELGEVPRKVELPSAREFIDVIASPFTPGEFFLSAGFGFVWRTNPFLDFPELRELKVEQSDKQVSRFAVRHGPIGPELWADTNRKGLYRLDADEVWRRPEVSAAPGPDGCSVSPDCGFHDVSSLIDDMDVGGPDVFMIADQCPALLWIQPELGCATRLEFPTDAPSLRGLSGTERGVWALRGRSLVHVWVR